MQDNSLFFSPQLIHWYQKNKRLLPWRSTKNPYFVWLSEIILQQTRVAQGLPYYEKFVSAFPTVYDLANASEQEVLKLWQGLGYYSRARNLHFTAKYVANELQGIFPTRYAELVKLKGVGDYTASAIASICFIEPTAVVDGNVYRVLSRYFGIDTPINTTKGNKEFKILAQSLIDIEDPGTFNQALMEFGARYCVPQNPNCNNCIFSETCVANATNKVTELPKKLGKTKIKKHYFNYLVFLSAEGETLLEQRTEKGIWQQLYQFPLIDSSKEISIRALKNAPSFKELFNELDVHKITKYNEDPVLHKLSHKHLYTTFWIVEVGSLTSDSSVNISEIAKYPVPVLLGNFISEFVPFQQ